MQPEWSQMEAVIRELESSGLVTRTFRRLDPARQKAIVEAVLNDAAVHGPASLNIKRVAARAGVSVGSLYTYFSNRQGLLDFAVELTTRMITTSFEESAAYLEAVPLREAIRMYIEYGLEWSRSQGGWLPFFGRAAYQGDPEMAERVVKPVASAMLDVIVHLMKAAHARGELSQDLDVEASARLVNALLIAAGDSQLLPYLNNYFQMTSEDMPFDRLLAALVDFIMRGIEARQEG